ncbi:oligosaccharide flippase family protein [uncultured Castellaniella sp.]|uniref:oligosaccharide flippase family protein n=1 Tax=uncultured Castellaniella sp. TaxID=647907 RepID=UPI002635B59C|nr:oligosaccharide flippase family protein [uncultured Castellaniella sp.]
MTGRSTLTRVARNAGALYLVHIVSFLVPVFEIPVLARALGAAQYGQILFCQALALTASLWVEYGFNINAAQQAALAHERPSDLNRLFSQVLLAKCLLAAPVVLLLLAAWGMGLLDAYLGAVALLAFVLAYFLAFGFSPIWYFQGRERMAAPVLLDVVLRLCGLAILAALVRTPDDFWLALPLLAIPPMLNTILTNIWCRYEIGALRWDAAGAWGQIRQGFHFFVYRSASSLAMSAVPVFLGVTSGKQAVGEFAPPEKLIKGMTSLALPFLTAVFPVFARRLRDRTDAATMRIPIIVLAGVGVTVLVGVALAAWLGPWVLDLMLGQGFPEARLVYDALLAVAPLRIMSQSIAMILLIPAGRAKQASYVISAGSILGVLLGSCLSVFYGGLGMAAGLVAAEAGLLAVLLGVAVRVVRRAGGSAPDAGVESAEDRT